MHYSPRGRCRPVAAETLRSGDGHELGARPGARLAHQALHVLLNGSGRDMEPSRDLLVRQALGDEHKHVSLAGGDAEPGPAARRRPAQQLGAARRQRINAMGSETGLRGLKPCLRLAPPVG